MSPKHAKDSQWWAKGFATIKSGFAAVLRDGPPPQIPDVDQRRLRAIGQPRDYFGAIVAGTLAQSLQDTPRITERELEWIQKHYAVALLEDLRSVKRAIGALTPRPVAMAAVPEELCTLVRSAFILGADLQRYHGLMYQLSHVVRGAKNLSSTQAAARRKGEKARRESRAHDWRRELEERHYGSAEAAYARIGRRERLQPGTIKKAILRLRDRPGRQ